MIKYHSKYVRAYEREGYEKFPLHIVVSTFSFMGTLQADSKHDITMREIIWNSTG